MRYLRGPLADAAWAWENIARRRVGGQQSRRASALQLTDQQLNLRALSAQALEQRILAAQECLGLGGQLTSLNPGFEKRVAAPRCATRARTELVRELLLPAVELVRIDPERLEL